jgi:hypothetical protein
MVEVAARTGALLIDINPDDGPFAQAARAAGGLWLTGAAATRVPELTAAIAGIAAR